MDPSTHTAYVANQRDGTVSVINGATNAVTAIIEVGDSPSAVAVDPSTDTAYVANYGNGGNGSVSVINGGSLQRYGHHGLRPKPRPPSPSAGSRTRWGWTRPRTPST